MHRCTAVLLLLVVALYFLSAEGKTLQPFYLFQVVFVCPLCVQDEVHLHHEGSWKQISITGLRKQQFNVSFSAVSWCWHLVLSISLWVWSQITTLFTLIQTVMIHSAVVQKSDLIRSLKLALAGVFTPWDSKWSSAYIAELIKDNIKWTKWDLCLGGETDSVSKSKMRFLNEFKMNCKCQIVCFFLCQLFGKQGKQLGNHQVTFSFKSNLNGRVIWYISLVRRLYLFT